MVLPRPRNTALVTAATIDQEYRNLLQQHPHLAPRPAQAAPAVTPEQAMIAKLRAGMAGGASGAYANALDRAPSRLPPRLGQVRLASVTPVSRRIQRLLERRPDLKHKFAAAIPPGKLPFGAAPPKLTTAAQPAAKIALKPKPVVPPVPPAMSVPKPAPVATAQPIQSQILGAESSRGIADAQKLGEFHLRGVHSRAATPPVTPPPPGQIRPDNGVRELGTNFALRRTNDTTSAVRQAFDSINPQATSDLFLNSLTEGTVPTVGQ